MSGLGQRLREERENRGLRRVDVAKATKVPAHHLAAIEYENFADLPEDGIARGFVRAYAEYLELDPEAIVSELSIELEARPPRKVSPTPTVEVEPIPDVPAGPPEARERRQSLPRWLVPSALLVLVLAVLLTWVRAGRDAPPSDPHPARAEVAPEVVTEETPLPEIPVRNEDPEVAEAEPDPPIVEAPEPKPRPVAVATVGELSIPDYGVGTGVHDHALVGEAEEFPEGSYVWFWTRVRGGAPGRGIRHVWIREGRVVESIGLELGGSHWRTQSRKILWGRGSWAVEARDASGTVLARSEFACVR